MALGSPRTVLRGLAGIVEQVEQDACTRGHEQFCEGVAEQMPTEEAAAAVRDGCRRLQTQCLERLGQSMSSCRNIFTALSVAGKMKPLKESHTVQPSRAELEAVHLRVNHMWKDLHHMLKDLQHLEQQVASTCSQELANGASVLPQDAPIDNKITMLAIQKDIAQLEELKQSLKRLHPQLESELNAVTSCKGDESAQQGLVLD